MITNVLSALPHGAAGVITALAVGSLCVAALIDALIDLIIAKTASKNIATEQGALEALRIRSFRRRLIGRRPATSTQSPTPSSAQADEDAAREAPKSKPHDEPC